MHAAHATAGPHLRISYHDKHLNLRKVGQLVGGWLAHEDGVRFFPCPLGSRSDPLHNPSMSCHPQRSHQNTCSTPRDKFAPP